MSARRRIVQLTLALGASIAVAEAVVSLAFVRDGAFEGRPLPPYGTQLTPAQRERIAERRADPGGVSPFDPELGWVNRAGVEDFNSIGARGPREYPERPEPGVVRIVSFGDSFTHCAQVPWDASWQAQLEALEPGWETINLGVNGYGVDQALLRYRRDGRGLGAHVVCIGFMLENVARHVNRYKPLLAYETRDTAVKPRFVLEDGELRLVPLPFEDERAWLDAVEDGSITARLAEHERWSHVTLPAPLWRSSLVRLAVAALESGRRDYGRLWTGPDAGARELTIALLAAFHREAMADGARGAPVLIWPPEPDLRRFIASGRRFWTSLLDALDERGVPHVDLAEPLAEAARTTGVDALYEGNHLSREGNEVVARTVREWIEARGIEGR